MVAPDDGAEEMDMLLSMFPDEVCRDPTHPLTLVLMLPFRFVLHVTLPPRGYPETSYPSLFVAAGPNAPLITHFLSQLTKALREEVSLGGPMLLHIFTLAQEMASELQQAGEAASRDAEARRDAMESDAQLALAVREASSVEVWTSHAITDRKSKFVAHMARVDSEEAVRAVVMHLRFQKHIAEATHPTIYAYRFTDSAGMLHQGSDDDGETGAAARILFLLEQLKVDGYVVVVTRWFGGILLGPDRFKHVMEVARSVILTIPRREQEASSLGGKRRR
ncbi:hypothetical protein TraAM80_06061 [Trypanosoma rangeli]|uniref:RWD domain-containing protein n=1 Tax=Trypanosoma rangeli TaxID=5698 RepID=A0A422NC53_TRYRA|nr:uncharacterized protein TraAM80_06061 [Trypanosoma rangeli]RNF03055.1 hypothetical protein TraAM80_06061 [Trypanosoma rangeli]|eukprot:RNF03055.1 hypothetical protein TraAM80_06061 [Trypanosoma rangeli]